MLELWNDAIKVFRYALPAGYNPASDEVSVPLPEFQVIYQLFWKDLFSAPRTEWILWFKLSLCEAPLIINWGKDKWWLDVAASIVGEYSSK